jgi:hypothetical protein
MGWCDEIQGANTLVYETATNYILYIKYVLVITALSFCGSEASPNPPERAIKWGEAGKVTEFELIGPGGSNCFCFSLDCLWNIKIKEETSLFLSYF